MADSSLVGSSQAENRAAFARLIDRHYKGIYRFAYHYTANHSDADEICQETFLRAFANMSKLKDASRFKGWIFTIASNILKKRAKRIGREKAIIANDRDAFEARAACGQDAGPFAALCAKEKTMIVRERLQEMPDQMRLTAILILMQGLSQKEAAVILGRSEASVSRDLDMARKWFRTKLRNLD
jgi:RNA polymerase sigma-70 factor (ECF subfamily)